MSSPTPTDPWSLPELTRARRAIVVVDVVESVRLMQEDEAGFIDRWRRFVHHVRTELLPMYGGRLVKSLGDGMLLEFEAAPQAMAAALRMQSIAAQFSPLSLRIGAHVSDVVVDDLDLYGTGVNLAARLTTLARPGEVVVSTEAREGLLAGVDVRMQDMGECYVKHLPEPVRAFRITAPDNSNAPQPAVASEDLRPTIAVLPFHAEDGSVCADLLTEALTAGLSRSAALNVISRLSCLTLRGRNDSLEIAGSTLRADYVLSGRVIHDGERYTTVAELANVRSGAVVWAHSGNAPIGGLLAWQCPLVGALIEGTTNAVLAHVLQRVRGSELPTLETYALLFGGVTLLHRMGRRDFDRAHDLLQAAADRAPRHPSPQAWLAQWHVLRAQQGWVLNPQETASRARDCAQRALDADPDDSLALTMDALVHVHFLRRLDEGAALYERAVTVNPNDSMAWLHKGMLHAFRGQAEAGVKDTERALTLSPLDPMKYYYDSLAASAAATAGRYERAIELAERSLAVNCLHTSTLRVLAFSQTLSGQVDAARATVTRLLTLEPDFTVQRFLARAPGADFEVGQRFARALREAGVPA